MSQKRLKLLPLIWILMLFNACNGQVQTLKTSLTAKDSVKVSNFGFGKFKVTLPETNLILKSEDGGQTWKNVSAGLPEDVSIGEVFLKEKEVFLGTQSGFFQQINGTWQPAPANTKEKNPYEHTPIIIPSGALLVGSRKGVRKSDDQGKTWKVAHDSGWAGEIVESEGVLLCTNEKGILRSADGGETWNLVISEGGVGIDVEVIKGGFAAITFNTESETRRVRISKDGGKNWEAIDAGLPPQLSISGIKQMGNSLFCGHPGGVYRSDDYGKTWKLMLPSVGEKVFNLFVVGSEIYAVPKNGGC